jgi:hypothetical protein
MSNLPHHLSEPELTDSIQCLEDERTALEQDLTRSCSYCTKPAVSHVCADHESSTSLHDASRIILDQAQQIAKLNTELSAIRNPLLPPF